MAVATRVYEWRLMRINGPINNSETCAYLLEDELHDVQGNTDGEDGRMTLKHMKETIDDLKKLQEQRELRKQNFSGKQLEDAHQIALDERLKNRSGRNKLAASSTKRNRGNSVTPFAAPETAPESIPESESKSTNEGIASDTAPDTNRKAPIPIERHSTIRFDNMLNVISRRRRSSTRQSMITQQRIVFITHSGIQTGLFLFNSPGFYFSMRDVCNLLLCLYYALYLTTFIAVSLKTRSLLRYNMICIPALLACVIVQSYIIRASSIINSVSKFNSDVVGRVIEEQEEDNEIEQTIREKLLQKVKHAVGAENVTNMPRLKKAVNQLFSEMQNLDGISDNLVSKDELKVLLQKLNIFFSKSKFDRAFEIIDIDMSGTITLSEFIDFIFPDDAREQRIRSRISKLQARGLIKKPGSPRNDDTTKKNGSFNKFYQHLRKVRRIIGMPSEHSIKYSASGDSFDASDDVAEFKEKQKGIKARAAAGMSRGMLKMNLVKAFTHEPQGKEEQLTSSKLLNTLAANKLLLAEHQMTESVKAKNYSNESSPRNEQDGEVFTSDSPNIDSELDIATNNKENTDEELSEVTAFTTVPSSMPEPMAKSRPKLDKLSPAPSLVMEFEEAAVTPQRKVLLDKAFASPSQS
jgi:hypothetical protein